MLSGGFDPAHIGHLAMVQDAARFGYVWIALNSDEWLRRKKGYAFMRWTERRALLSAWRAVADVFSVDDSADHVAGAIRAFKPDFFANGGDRTTSHPEERAACIEVGCQELFGIGGGKIQSSSELVKRVPR